MSPPARRGEQLAADPGPAAPSRHTRRRKPTTSHHVLPPPLRLGSVCAILADLRAVRSRCAAGAAPGPRLRIPHTHAGNDLKTVTTTTTRLDRFRCFRD